MRLVLAGVGATLALMVAAPSALAGLPAAPTLPAAPVEQTVSTVQQTTSSVQRHVSNVQQAAKVEPHVAPAQQQVAAGVEATKQTASQAPSAQGPRVAAPAPDLAARPSPASPADPVRSAVGVAGKQVDAQREAHDPGSDRLATVRDTLAPARDLLAALGDTLRQIAPVGALLAPVTPLLTDLADVAGLDPSRPRFAAVSLGDTLGLTAERGAPAISTPSSARAPAAPAAPGARVGAAIHGFQAASARPPAAEVGGRPVSPPPWTAPAPAAGGAASVFSGAVFVPLVGLLALAALAAPRLLRRLDELPAFVRPAPFICALERPG